MSGLAALISGGVNGWFDGRDWRENRDRQRKLDKYRDAAEQRAAERFGWDRQDHEVTTSERNRAISDRNEYEQAIDAFINGEDAQIGMRPSTSNGPQQGVLGETERTPYQTVPPANEPATAAPGAVRVPKAGDITSEPLSQAKRAETAPNEEGMTINEAVAAIGPDIVGYDYGHIDPRLARAAGIEAKGGPVEEPTFDEWRKMSRSERTAAGLPVSEIGGQWHYRNRSGGWEADPNGTISDAVRGVAEKLPAASDKNMDAALGARREAGNVVSDAVQGADDMVGDAAAVTGRLGNKIVRGAGYATSLASPEIGAKILEYADKTGEAYDRWAKEGFVPGVARDLDGAAGKTATATAQAAEARSAAAETLGAIQTPAAEVAAATIDALGATKGGGKMTEAQVNTAVKAGAAYYRDNHAKEVVRVLLKQGKLDQAIKFEEWLDTKETRAGMESWLKATVAASVGDFDGFSDAIVDAYNRLDYFGDDTTIVKDKSGFTKDEDGNITGAKITFRNETSGQTFEQVYDDPNDIIRMGINMLSPEQAFEWHLKSMESAQKLSGDRAKKSDDARKDDRKRVEDAMKALADADPQFGQLPLEEQVKLARARIAAIDGAAEGSGADGPPVSYRPEW